MLKDRPIAYEGNDKYIFISYAHKDTDEVFQILSVLQDQGYRLWYDDGIAPGSEWPENIATHLNNSALCLAFVTQNSMDSPNCRREINFALSKNIPFLSVVLSTTKMPLGMELQLSAQQSILKYNYTTEAEFLNKITSCELLKPCLIPESERTVPEQENAPAPVSEKEAPSEKVTKIDISDTKISVNKVGENGISDITDIAVKKSRTPLYIGIAAAFLVVALGIFFLTRGGSDDTVSTPASSSEAAVDSSKESTTLSEETSAETETTGGETSSAVEITEAAETTVTEEPAKTVEATETEAATEAEETPVAEEISEAEESTAAEEVSETEETTASEASDNPFFAAVYDAESGKYTYDAARLQADLQAFEEDPENALIGNWSISGKSIMMSFGNNGIMYMGSGSGNIIDNSITLTPYMWEEDGDRIKIYGIDLFGNDLSKAADDYLYCIPTVISNDLISVYLDNLDESEEITLNRLPLEESLVWRARTSNLVTWADTLSGIWTRQTDSDELPDYITDNMFFYTIGGTSGTIKSASETTITYAVDDQTSTHEYELSDKMILTVDGAVYFSQFYSVSQGILSLVFRDNEAYLWCSNNMFTGLDGMNFPRKIYLKADGQCLLESYSGTYAKGSWALDGTSLTLKTSDTPNGFEASYTIIANGSHVLLSNGTNTVLYNPNEAEIENYEEMLKSK